MWLPLPAFRGTDKTPSPAAPTIRDSWPRLEGFPAPHGPKEPGCMSTSRPRLGFTLAVLFAINPLNFSDRRVPGAVAEPIRKELGLNDEQLGWITTAFVLLYAAISMPLGHWADVGRRKAILVGGVWLWSAFTFL